MENTNDFEISKKFSNIFEKSQELQDF